MNYYELLEISPSASIEVIRNAYKTLAKKYHPDTYRGDVLFAEEKMKLLNEAISVLENEDKRGEYNKINGINPLSRSGYSEYGRNNMINVDENGEPIFFSYDIDLGGKDDYDEPDGDSYMDIIDEFIKNSRGEPDPKPKKKPPKKKDNEIIPDEVIADIAADISEVNAKKFGTSDGAQTHENAEGPTVSEPEYISAGSGAKTGSYSKRMKAYYIAVSAFVLAIILLFILIMRHTDLSNIQNLFSGVPEKPASGDGGAAVENPAAAEDHTAETERPEDIYEDVPHPVEEPVPAPPPDDIPDDFIVQPPAETTTAALTEAATTPEPEQPTDPVPEETTEPETAAEPETEAPLETPTEPAPPAETEGPAPEETAEAAVPEETEIPTEPEDIPPPTDSNDFMTEEP